MRILHAAAVVLAVAASAPAAAERIVSSVSTHQVLITSNFSGLDLVLFGTVERDATTPPRRGNYNLVVTVTGPKESIVTRRKERVLGIWVNRESRNFIDVPSYLAVLSNRPVEEIVDTETARRLQLGLRRTLLPQQIGPDLGDTPRDDPFRMAFLRLKAAKHLYVEQTAGVTFLTPTLFRATIPLPAEVPIGAYDVDLKLFVDGAQVARASSAFEIVKAGFEQFIATSAQSNAILYGLATVSLALMTGWFASVVFRRD
jgi:uncharacterized protein (TIGR02186 family)